MQKATKVQNNVNLDTLAGGAFAEKLNEALIQVAENIQNPNTEATTKRMIAVSLKFTPSKSRQLVGTQISVTTKLAATEAIDIQMIMGINMRTGQIEIAEYDGQIRGQMSLNLPQEEPQQREESESTQESENQEPPVAAEKPLDLKNRNKPAVEPETDNEPVQAAGLPEPEKDFDPKTGEILRPHKVVSLGNRAINA